jgi:hypothetical protein
MLLPSLFLIRSALVFAEEQGTGFIDLALIVYRLGASLLARDSRAVFSLDYTTRLVRMVGAALSVFAAFGLLQGAANAFFLVVAALAALFFLTSVLVTHASRMHAGLFADATSGRD